MNLEGGHPYPSLMVQIFGALKKSLGNSTLQRGIDPSLSANFPLKLRLVSNPQTMQGGSTNSNCEIGGAATLPLQAAELILSLRQLLFSRQIGLSRNADFHLKLRVNQSLDWFDLVLVFTTTCASGAGAGAGAGLLSGAVFSGAVFSGGVVSRLFWILERDLVIFAASGASVVGCGFGRLAGRFSGACGAGYEPSGNQ